MSIRPINFPAQLNKVTLQYKTIHSIIRERLEKLLGHCDAKLIKYTRRFQTKLTYTRTFQVMQQFFVTEGMPPEIFNLRLSEMHFPAF